MSYAEVNGTTLYYKMLGTGVPLILIHPPLLTSTNFQYQLGELSDRFRVIVPDLRGHGRSRPSKRPVTYRLIAEDMVALMDELGIRQACIGGYSTGGGIALEAMLSYPDRFIGGIVISGMTEVSTLFLKSEIQTAMRLTKLRAKRLLAAAICTGNADSSQTFRRLFREAVRGDVRNMHQYYKDSLIYRCTDRLHQIKSPVLALFGEKDWGFRRYAHILQAHLPNCELHWIPDVRHQLPTKAWREMNALIRQWEGKLDLAKRLSAGAENAEKVAERPPVLLDDGEAVMEDNPF